jgi:hypothetical protein
VDLGPVFRVEASGITRSGAVATVTATAHGFTTGDTAVIHGADQAEYNVAAVVTVTGPDAFTYVVAGTPTTPATGNFYVAPGRTSDIGVLASVERPTGNCDVEFILSRDGSNDLRTTNNGYIELTERVTRGLNLSVVLTGNEIESPYLFSGAQVVLGDLQESASYISRAIPCAEDAKVVTTFDQIIPPSAGVVVEIEEADEDWLAVTQDSAIPLGDGWLEATHTQETFATGGLETRVRLTLTGDPSSRPYLQNLRVVTV